MANTVFTRGSEWSEATLFDGWGDVTSDQAEALAGLVCDRFQELAKDTSVYWQPQTSEVIGNVDDDVTTEQLETWRKAALDELGACVTDESDNGDLCARVAAALRLGYCTGCGKTFDPAAGPWKETGDGDLCQECTKTWESESDAEIRLQKDTSDG